MDKYGIFTTLGDLISGEDIINSSEIVKTLTACSTTFYLSYTNSKTIFGTTLDVQKSHTRVHTVVFLQEIDWKGKKPRAIRRENIDDFFRAVILKLGELDYSIVCISSDIFNSYLTALQHENNTVKHVSYSHIPSIINYSIGRLLYGKKVLGTSTDPQISISYLCTLTQEYEPFLKYGYTFAITKFEIKDSDVCILIDTQASCFNFDVDSGKIYLDSDKLNYYIAHSELVDQKNVKSFPLPHTDKASLSSGMIKHIMENKNSMNKAEIDKYAQFLNSESIPYEPQLLEIRAFNETNKSPKSKKASNEQCSKEGKSQPDILEKERQKDDEKKHSIFSFFRRKMVSVWEQLKNSTEADSENVNGSLKESRRSNPRSKCSRSKSKEKKDKINKSAHNNRRSGEIFLIRILTVMLVILLLITIATILVILTKNGYIPDFLGLFSY